MLPDVPVPSNDTAPDGDPTLAAECDRIRDEWIAMLDAEDLPGEWHNPIVVTEAA